jgi:hypothetical protein
MREKSPLFGQWKASTNDDAISGRRIIFDVMPKAFRLSLSRHTWHARSQRHRGLRVGGAVRQLQRISNRRSRHCGRRVDDTAISASRRCRRTFVGTMRGVDHGIREVFGHEEASLAVSPSAEATAENARLGKFSA